MRTKWSWRHGVLLLVILIFIGLVYTALRQAKSQADEAAREAARATEQALDFAKLCNASISDKVIFRFASGPIWMYHIGATYDYSPVPEGSEGYADSIFEVEALICVHVEYELIETCNYIDAMRGLRWTKRRSAVTTVVTLVDIQTNNKVSERSYTSLPPACTPKAVDSNPLYGEPPSDTIILQWVRERWRP